MAKETVAGEAQRLEAARLFLAGVAGNERLDDALDRLRPFADFAFPFPGDVLVELAADALELSGATRATPVSLSDAPETYLSEWTISGNTAHQKSRAAIEASVALHAGVAVDYGAVAGWWQVQDFAFYAFQAAVIMIRLAAATTGRATDSICAEIAAKRQAQL
jgi:hypothetical protein